ncbi:MAG: uroporphyrinogen-III synthase [Myxococcota bacterium]
MVTRPRERAQELCFLLEDEGAEVLALSVLELSPPDDPRPLRSAAEQLQRYAWVVFASPSAVQALVEAAREAGTLTRLSQVKLAAVGPATAKALRDHGLTVAKEAAVSTGEGLFEALQGELSATEEVLLPAAQEGRKELELALADVGVPVTRVAAYRSAPAQVSEALLQELSSSPPQVALFASPRTLEAFLELTGEAGRGMLTAAKLVAIGPTTEAAMRSMGFLAAAVAERPTPEALVEAAVVALRG